MVVFLPYNCLIRFYKLKSLKAQAAILHKFQKKKKFENINLEYLKKKSTKQKQKDFIYFGHH